MEEEEKFRAVVVELCLNGRIKPARRLVAKTTDGGGLEEDVLRFDKRLAKDLTKAPVVGVCFLLAWTPWRHRDVPSKPSSMMMTVLVEQGRRCMELG